MAGHVPKFGAQNGGNFTEIFAQARSGAKTGSGDAAAAATEPKRAAAAAARRVAGSGERDVPEPPRRAGGSEREGSSRARGGRGTAARKAPRNVNEEHAGASHLPKFGDWNNTGDAGEANYTVMFSAASRERQGGSAVELGTKNSSGGRGGSGDMSRSSHGSKKHSPSWWCFS